MASSANHSMAAVTPEPQLVTIGRSRSTPAALNRSAIFAGEASRPFSISSVNGTLNAPGIWPGRTPGRGSAASPRKRSAGRASTTCAVLSDSTPATSCMPATADRFSVAVKLRGRAWTRRSRPAGLLPSISACHHRGRIRCARRRRGMSTTRAARRPILRRHRPRWCRHCRCRARRHPRQTVRRRGSICGSEVE